MHKLIPALLAACALPAQATVIIDDFSSGPYGIRANASPSDTNIEHIEAGTMAGGARYHNLLLRGNAALEASMDITDGALTVRTDRGIGHRLDLGYGIDVNRVLRPLHLDLSGENALRFHFNDLPLGINFNVLLYYRNELDNYSQVGYNIFPSAGPVDVDFRFSEFARVIADPHRPADFSDIGLISIVIQSGAITPFGGEGYSLDSITAVHVPEPASAVLLGMGLVGLGFARRRALTDG